MIFYYVFLWSLIFNCGVIYAGRDEFKLDNYEVESRKWKNPHSNIFSLSDDPVANEMSELLGTARGAVQCEELHAAIEACQSRLLSLGQQAKNTNVNILRFIKYLLKIYDETMEYHEGIILMKITDEDLKVLKSFANDGKFSSLTYSNIYDLLQAVFTVPPSSMLDRIVPSMNIFVKMWDLLLYVLQEINFRLMQLVFSTNAIIYASLICPIIVFITTWRRGYSLKTAFVWVVVTILVTDYFVELRAAIEDARAKDMARMLRVSNLPPECAGVELGWYDWIRSTFTSGNSCEQYFRDQTAETSIEPSKILWKLLFAPLPIAMEKFGDGMSLFFTKFVKDLSWPLIFTCTPVAVLALMYFCGLGFAFLTGGSANIFLLGSFNFWNNQDRGSSARIDSSRADSAPSLQPAVSNTYNVHLYNSPQPTSQVPSIPDVNDALQHLSSQVSQLHGGLGALVQGCSTSNPTGSPREQLALPETSHGKLGGSPRRPPLVSALSENYSNRSDDNNCALKEVGSGDFISRDSNEMLPPSVIRRKKHRRQFSL